MKKGLTTFALVLIAFATFGCVAQANYTDIASKEWRLVKVKTDRGYIEMDRKALEKAGFFRAFTIVFETDRISGAGAPNRFFVPYEIGENQTISVKPIGVTQIASLTESEGFKESEFFSYLQNARAWNLDGDELTLSTVDSKGAKATLIFAGE
ncbi:MAG: META domain-containing protein [Helicobacteraceae bacterium]|jgi:heat shock protein HslJ|nr:META domain-containing protein [Helicobacteraceae bacterium]